MKINIKIRLKNPVFWAQIALAVLSPVLVGMGLQWQDMTTWDALGGALLRALGNPVIFVSILGSVWTALTDPTTAGVGDSTRALAYERPRREEKP